MRHSFRSLRQRFGAGHYGFMAAFVVLLGGCETVAIQVLNMGELTRLEVVDSRLYILGTLNSQTFDQMRDKIDARPDIDTLVFTAMPGSIDDDTTFAMGRWLRERQLKTHLLSNSVIASGAVDLFLSGVDRTAERGAQVGVHSWSDGSKEARDFPKDSPEHDLNADYVTFMLADDSFYWYTIYEAPADEISWMDEAAIIKYGLLTEPFQNPSGEGTPFEVAFNELRQEILED